MFDYRSQQDQRGWYGFNYGDVMHTYDFDRHEWRYDIGGFAWDNSNSPPTLAVALLCAPAAPILSGSPKP